MFCVFQFYYGSINSVIWLSVNMVLRNFNSTMVQLIVFLLLLLLLFLRNFNSTMVQLIDV